MTIYAPREPAFTCAICGVDHDPDSYRNRWGYGPTRPIPPLCQQCLHDWGTGRGGWGDLNRDRRIIRQVSALAQALHVEAHRIQRGEGPLYASA